MKPFLFAVLCLLSLAASVPRGYAQHQTVRVRSGESLLVETEPIHDTITVVHYDSIPYPVHDTIRIPVPYAVHDTITVRDTICPPVVIDPVDSTDTDTDTVVVVPPPPAKKDFLPRFIIDSSKLYDGKSMGVQPGDTVGILAGTYFNLILQNFKGAPGKPITFINYKGRVVLRGTTQNNGNFSIKNCQYWRLTGTGVAGLEFGFDVSSSYKDVSALPVSGKSTNFEIDHIEVSQSGFAGMMIKMDPVASDPSTQLGNFTMYDVHVHDNYVHDTRGEGFYIGFSFWNNGSSGPKGPDGKRIFPHEIKGLHLHHNTVLNAGCEGIQYSCSPGASVHHNQVSKTGVSPFSNAQNAGVQISGGSSGDFYQNTIDSAYGIGLMVVGALRGGDTLRISNVKVTNSNVFAGADKLPAETAGMFVDERPCPPGIPAGGTLILSNVTIHGARQDAIRLYNQPIQTIIRKSVLTGWNRFAIDKQSGVTLSTSDITTSLPAPIGIGYQPE